MEAAGPADSTDAAPIRSYPCQPVRSEFIRGPTTTLAAWKPRIRRIPRMQHRFDLIRAKPFDLSSSVAQQRRSPYGSRGSSGFHGCSTDSILSVVTRSIRVHPWPNNDARRMEAAGPADDLGLVIMGRHSNLPTNSHAHCWHKRLGR
jgi:hypothetical protein